MLRLLAVLSACLPSLEGLCFTPVLHGFTPDVLLHGLGSDLYCPQPLTFDRYICTCVDPAAVTAPEVNLLQPLELTRSGTGPFHLHEVVGLPDMHGPAPWLVSGKTSLTSGDTPVVSPLRPFASFNLPATSEILKAAAKVTLMRRTMLHTKHQELLDKMRWQQQLEAATSNTPVTSLARGTFDDFMKDAVRRVLYGY